MTRQLPFQSPEKKAAYSNTTSCTAGKQNNLPSCKYCSSASPVFRGVHLGFRMHSQAAFPVWPERKLSRAPAYYNAIHHRTAGTDLLSLATILQLIPHCKEFYLNEIIWNNNWGTQLITTNSLLRAGRKLLHTWLFLSNRITTKEVPAAPKWDPFHLGHLEAEYTVSTKEDANPQSPQSLSLLLLEQTDKAIISFLIGRFWTDRLGRPWKKSQPSSPSFPALSTDLLPALTPRVSCDFFALLGAIALWQFLWHLLL